jgi:nucleoside-diphosphate-sugar epimerase
MDALVTGGTGFVGANLIRELLEAGASVRALARPGSDRRALADLPIEIAEGGLKPTILQRDRKGEADALIVLLQFRRQLRSRANLDAAFRDWLSLHPSGANGMPCYTLFKQIKTCNENATDRPSPRCNL